MGKDQLAALARIIDQQLNEGADNAVVGTWTIRWDAKKEAFYFEKCEDGFYCEERPAVIDVQGTVLDKGGPLIFEEQA
jgi:hypothetical protein